MVNMMRKGPLIKNKNSFVFLCAIIILSILSFKALSRYSSVFSLRNSFTSFSSSVSERDFLVSKESKLEKFKNTFELRIVCSGRYFHVRQVAEEVVIEIIH